jgi:ribulose-5-phosphate 4-epimerase/fuculose-1-phosphate aldolase
MEKYRGVKFKVIFMSKSPPYDERVRELASWCRIFHSYGLTPIVEGRSMGNLSFRLHEGFNEFIITASGLGPKNDLSPECFVKVTKCDFNRRTVYVFGAKKPSSESLLHYRIYELRDDVNAIFHGHSEEILRGATDANLIQTKRWHPHGSLRLVRSVEEVLNKNNFIVMKGHGFLSLGGSMQEAGRQAIKILDIVKRSAIHDRVKYSILSL